MQTPANSAWHWPHFDHPLCGEVNDRERLGLPDRYIAGRFDAALQIAYRGLQGESQERLLHILNDNARPLTDRLAAGNLLARIGDPRLNSDDPSMITIPGGRVEIGLPFADVDGVMKRYQGLGLEPKWIEKECPRHSTQLKPYRIARYPVTNVEYRAFLLDTGYPELPTSWTFRRYPEERANHPVYTLSAAAATAYARWLAQHTARGFRLPSEAEWEFAAAGTAGLEFPWGDTFDADRANTAETGLFTSSPVGAFTDGDSPFGVADMAGNVEEYVADLYAPYSGGRAIADHLTDIHGAYHVARGGSFARFRDLARTRRRHGYNPRSATYAMGFRLAEEI
jgi:formylglycine-generating enzyme required for sulfatase activity